MTDTFDSFVWGYLFLWIIIFASIAFSIWKIQKLESRLNSWNEDKKEK